MELKTQTQKIFMRRKLKMEIERENITRKNLISSYSNFW